MQITAESLAKQIVDEVASVKKSTPNAMITEAVVKPGDFCGLWVKAKPILQLLSGIAIVIPGVGATAGGVLQGLIKVGDLIAAQMCK